MGLSLLAALPSYLFSTFFLWLLRKQGHLGVNALRGGLAHSTLVGLGPGAPQFPKVSISRVLLGLGPPQAQVRLLSQMCFSEGPESFLLSHTHQLL